MVGICVCAQEQVISTDRPDQSDGTATVPVRKLQLEDGLTVAEETVVNNLMVRYGLTATTEVRLLADAGKTYNAAGLQPVTLSIKQRLLKAKGIFPAVSAVAYLSAGPLASADYESDEWPFALVLAFENEISDNFSLGYNIGASDNFESLNLTLNLGFTTTDRLSVFAEYFSSLNRTDNRHNFDVGLLYLVSPVFQLDAAVGRSLFSSEERYFGTFGISYLFNR